MKKAIRSLLVLPALILLGSCGKDDPEPQPAQGRVTMKFANYAGSEPLALNGPGYYLNAHGDSFQVKTYKYYVTNVVLVGGNGVNYTEAESYHLIDQAESSRLSFTMQNVPPGTYTSVKLLLGVDRNRNTSGAQTGDLDPALGMFWAWSSGYIMAKMEGTFSNAGTATGFSFHLGGFTGIYSVLQEAELTLPEPLVVSANHESGVVIQSDVLKWFDSPNLIDFTVLNQVGMAGEDAWKISQNYARMLKAVEVQN